MRVQTLVLIAAFLAAPALACAGRTVGQTTDDAAISSRVEARLAADPDVHAFDVDVDTTNGVVTLRGKVDDASDKAEAEKLARGTEGVRGVHNELVVGERDFGDRAEQEASDAFIRAQVGTKLVADPEVSRWDIDIDVVDGVVTLSGIVENQEQKREAEDLTRRTDGVRDVVNELKVQPDDED